MLKKTLLAIMLLGSLGGTAVIAAESTNQAGASTAANPFGWMMPGGTTNANAFNPMAMMPMAGAYPNTGNMNLARPEGWSTFMNPATYPAMMNPATYGQFMSPQFYMQFADPNNMMAWMNPAAYGQFMNPNTYMQMMNPMAYMQFMNPGTYMQGMNPGGYATFMNPNSYMQWMNPAAYTMPNSGATADANWFDPNGWMQMTTPPQGQQAQSEQQ